MRGLEFILRWGIAVKRTIKPHATTRRRRQYLPFESLGVSQRLDPSALRVERISVVDVDVHQGNGTAIIFNDFSIYSVSQKDALG